MGVTFSKDAAKRIANAVRYVENQRPLRGGDNLPAGPQEEQMWGYVTGMGFSDAGQSLYSFVRVMPVTDDPDVTVSDTARYKLVDPVVSHYQAAFEANNQPCPANVVVRLHYAGLRKFGDEVRPMFIFVFTPAVVTTHLPVHDHRDAVTGGGFAFAVWHPGTGLPQQPWHL